MRGRSIASVAATIVATALLGAQVAGAAAPPRPTALTATAASSSAINLHWTDNSAVETGFEVQRSPANQSKFVKIAQTAANATTYPDTGLPAATAYKYRVRALKQAPR